MAIEMGAQVQRRPPTGAREPAAGSKRWGARLGGHRFRVRDRMFFTERLALLLHTGVPLHTALRELAAQAAEGAQRDVLRSLEQEVASGASFARALAQHPDAFPATYANLVDAAERGGFLPTVLERLRSMDERSEELRATLWSAFSYPLFLVAFSIGVVLFVLMVVFPKFGELFETIREQLPWTTVALMGASDLLLHHGLLVLGAAVAAAVLAGAALRRPAGRQLVERVLDTVPGLRSVVVELQLVQMLAVLGLSLGHGVPVVDALRSCREVMRGSRFRRFVERLEAGVVEGRGMAAGFREAGFLPPLVAQMVSTAEESGSLGPVFERVSAFYERQLRKRLLTLSKLAEPLLLLVMGAVVGLIVSSLILPIFKLSRAVR